MARPTNTSATNLDEKALHDAVEDGAFVPHGLLLPGVHNLHIQEREFFIDNLLDRIHVIIEIILVDRPCAMGV